MSSKRILDRHYGPTISIFDNLFIFDGKWRFLDAFDEMLIDSGIFNDSKCLKIQN
jgi:hypothetical protein